MNSTVEGGGEYFSKGSKEGNLVEEATWMYELDMLIRSILSVQ